LGSNVLLDAMTHCPCRVDLIRSALATWGVAAINCATAGAAAMDPTRRSTDRRALANEVPREPPSPRASTVEARPRRLRRAQPLPHRESWCRRLRIEIADVPECAAGKPRWSECRGWDSYGAPR